MAGEAAAPQGGQPDLDDLFRGQGETESSTRESRILSSYQLAIVEIDGGVDHCFPNLMSTEEGEDPTVGERVKNRLNYHLHRLGERGCSNVELQKAKHTTEVEAAEEEAARVKAAEEEAARVEAAEGEAARVKAAEGEAARRAAQEGAAAAAEAQQRGAAEAQLRAVAGARAEGASATFQCGEEVDVDFNGKYFLARIINKVRLGAGTSNDDSGLKFNVKYLDSNHAENYVDVTRLKRVCRAGVVAQQAVDSKLCGPKTANFRVLKVSTMSE